MLMECIVDTIVYLTVFKPSYDLTKESFRLVKLFGISFLQF